MNIENFIAKLENLNACEDSIEWLSTQDSIKSAWEDCERGDWLLWLVARLNINERKLFLAKGRVVEQVIHLMNDERSVKAVRAAIDYGRGKIGKDELKFFIADAYTASSATDAATDAAASTAAAHAAAYAAASNAASYASANYASAAATYAANAAASNAASYASANYASAAATYAANTDAAVADAADAKQLSLKKSADIVREIFVFEEIIKALCGELLK